MSLAGMAAVSCVLLRKVVVRSAPFQRTTEEEIKPLPLTVRVKPASPAVALEGNKEVKLGPGLLMVRTGAFEVPPPGAGLNTVTCAVPAVARSLAGMAAVSCVLLR